MSKNTSLNTSDPRLTAFVLGELSAEEAREIQAAVDQHAELQAECAAIRAVVSQIETVMSDEPLGAVPSPVTRPRPTRRWLVSAVVSALAASLVVALALPLVFDGGTLSDNRLQADLHLQDSNMVPDGDPETQRADQRRSVFSYYDSEGDASQIGNIGESSESSRIVLPKILSELASESSVQLEAQDSKSSQLEVVQDFSLAESGFLPGLVSSPEPDGQSFDQPGESGQNVIAPSRLAPSSSELASSPTDSVADGENQREVQRLGYIAASPRPMAVGRGVAADTLGVSRPDQRHDRLFGQQAVIRSGITIAGRPSADSFPVAPPIGELPPSRRPMPTPIRPPGQGTAPIVPFNDQRAEVYKDFMENEFKPVVPGEFSTFSIDVDTAAYTTMRRHLSMNSRPPAESVRLEEYINFFRYDYPQPDGEEPFATHIDVFSCPWQPEHLLARIGIKGKEYTVDERPALNLVFLIDVSGSMAASNRLPLVQQGLTELVEMLQPKDRVAIVTYANGTNLALPSVSGQEKRAILDTIASLRASGGTYGEAGIKLAYETARRYFEKEAQNRVILCTDGDFNVGTVDNKSLEQLIAEEAKSGVFLTILGFGMGNYRDDRLKTLSMRGNGNYGYVDTIEECRRLLVEGLTSTLFTIAKDVKIQVDFNPAHVAGYRLLGYENRRLRDEDFHNDAVDAGEIGAGHTVTALYELVPAGVRLPTSVDPSRYAVSELQSESAAESVVVDAGFSDELMFVKLRYKEPDGERSALLEYPVRNQVSEATSDSQFAAAVALYGMLLRSSRHSGQGTWDMVLEFARPNTKEDQLREEFIGLVEKAKELR